MDNLPFPIKFYQRLLDKTIQETYPKISSKGKIILFIESFQVRGRFKIFIETDPIKYKAIIYLLIHFLSKG